MKKKIIAVCSTVLIAIVGFWILWTYVIPSEDIKKGIKDAQADAKGLDRAITHCVSDKDCITLHIKDVKIYPFANNGFSFIVKGKKHIYGPGYRIIEE